MELPGNNTGRSFVVCRPGCKTSLKRYSSGTLRVLAVLASVALAGVTSARASLVLPNNGNDARACKVALAYLEQSPTARKVIERLQKSTAEYRILVGYPPFSLDQMAGGYGDGTIYWLPTDAMEWRTWALGQVCRRSPALVLLHELGHAYHDDLNPARMQARRHADKRDTRWGNAEERRTILEVENPAARELGEPERRWHASNWASHFRTFASTGPASVTERRDRPQFSALWSERPRQD